MKARVVAATARKTATANPNGRGPALQAPLIEYITKKADGHFRIFALSELVIYTERSASAVQSAMKKIIQAEKLVGLDVTVPGREWQYDPGKARLRQGVSPEPQLNTTVGEAVLNGGLTKKDVTLVSSLMDPYVPGGKIEVHVVGRMSDGSVILELPTGEVVRTRH